ncbi:MAG: ribonuclease Z [Nitrospirae bacterium]|nr:ribonuclease Z [Nitrospirota bacterium]
MKPTFHCRVVNGLFDDPVLYVRIIREGKALLFDAGDIWALNAREIHKIAHVFISHTHIDHFIGFDRLLRILLRRIWPLYIYGPEGIIESIKGRLSGYTWNLIQEYPLEFYVQEVRPESIVTVRFSASEGFEPVQLYNRENSGIVYENELFHVKAEILDHGIPVLGFCLQEKEHLNVDPVRLKELSLPVGPWLGRLKEAIRTGNLTEDIPVTEQGKVVRAEDMLKQGVVKKTRGQRIAYVVDVAPTEDNIDKIKALVSEADLLYIEAYFLEEDRDRAVERRHLTASLAGRIAAEAKVKRVIPLHVSPKYKGREVEVIQEVQQFYNMLKH